MKRLWYKLIDWLFKDELPEDVAFGIGKINGNHNGSFRKVDKEY